jgi:hypothetical protein
MVSQHYYFLQTYLNENTITQWLHILYIITIKNTNYVIFLQNEMVSLIEFQLRASIFGVDNLCTNLYQIIIISVNYSISY